MLETLVETVFTGDEASVALDTKAKSALTREWKKAHPPLSGTTSTAAELVDVDDDQEEDDC
jgi:hypothetical protein